MDDVLVVGSGGREYELARQLVSSSKVQKLYVAPGNAGTAQLDKTENVAIGATDVDDLVSFVKEQGVQTVVIGPDAALAAGLGDAMRAEGLAVFGPDQHPAQLESSKAFAVEFMTRHNIPQPERWVAHNLEEALQIIADKKPETYVLKADGLAAGKGVVLPTTVEEAESVLKAMFSEDAYDGAGKDKVLIQERLHGPEVSAFAVSDGKNVVMLPFAQDHKRLKDNDEGPNTGGMGAYSPVPEKIVSADQAAKINDIAVRSIEAIAKDGTPYKGVLYLGLMLAEERGSDPVIIEYNARFGDPETQIVLSVLSESGFDVPNLLLQAAKDDISGIEAPGKLDKTALTVCLAASGYPENPRKGDVIYGLDKTYDGVIIHHAGTKQESDGIVTNGGRVLYVTGIGATAQEAADHAYAAIGPDGVHFDGMQYRTDIGHQACG
jgi:phosphoribosylamine--glycine ligase